MRTVPYFSTKSAILIILIILVGFSYWSTSNLGFIELYDDVQYVIENSDVREGLTWNSIKWAFTANHAANWHPLTWMSHMLDCQLYGNNPGGHHFTSLVLHIINTLLLFFLMKKMTCGLFAGAFIAALFGVHPLHVESVAWIAERKDVLSTFFFFLTILFYFYYVNKGGVWRYTLALVLFVMGLMAKPMLVTLPCVLLLLDYWPLKRIDDKATFNYKRMITLFAEKLPFFMFSIFSSFLTIWAQKSWGAVASLRSLTVWQRTANAFISYVLYLFKTFWPMNLAVYYPHPIHFVLWKATAAFSLIAIITFLSLWYIKRVPWFFTGWFWYLGTLVPVIGFIQAGQQAMADRYTYIPIIGVFLIVTYGIEKIMRSCRYRKIVLLSGSIAIIAVLSILTRKQVMVWKNSSTLFGHAVEVTRNNYVAHSIYGVSLLGYGEFEKAISHFTEAYKIRPDLQRAHINIGIAYEGMGNLDSAVYHYRMAIEAEPGSWKAYNNMGLVLVKQKRYSEAIEVLKTALTISPDSWEANNNIGIAYGRKGDFQKSVQYYSRATELNPAQISPCLNRGNAYFNNSMYDDAINDYRNVIRLNPDYADIYRILGNVYMKNGDNIMARRYISEYYKRCKHCLKSDSVGIDDGFEDRISEPVFNNYSN
ncbi:MAG: tetratricopeptide repeat protein [Candidatus Omnitrophica bacterium]|nr:tetratricopeptide repeat protein [Candidatus Omnitrophota bacterium]